MINLLPPDVKEARLYGRRNIKLLAYAFSIVIVGVISVAIVGINLVIINSDQRKLNTEIASHVTELEELKNGQKSIDAITDQMKVIDKIYSGEVRFSEFIPKIGAVLPNGMVLNGLSLSGGKTSPLQLDVDMETQELAAVFLKNLQNSDLFESADINSIVPKGAAPKPGVKSYAYGATLVANFKGTAAAKKAAAAPAAAATPATGAKQ